MHGMLLKLIWPANPHTWTTSAGSLMRISRCCTLYLEHTLYIHYIWSASSIRHHYTFNKELFYLYLISSPQSPAKACGCVWRLECRPTGKLRAFSSQIWISLHHSTPVQLPHYNCWCLKDKGPPGGFFFVFWLCTSEKRPWCGTNTCWRDYISYLAQEHRRNLPKRKL